MRGKSHRGPAGPRQSAGPGDIPKTSAAYWVGRRSGRTYSVVNVRADDEAFSLASRMLNGDDVSGLCAALASAARAGRRRAHINVVGGHDSCLGRGREDGGGRKHGPYLSSRVASAD